MAVNKQTIVLNLCLLLRYYEGRRKHDVNILTRRKLEKRRDVCVLRFFFKAYLHHSMQFKNGIINIIVQLLLRNWVLMLIFFSFVCFCIRQHDVNILMLRILRRARDVCVLRFFLIFILLKNAPCCPKNLKRICAVFTTQFYLGWFFVCL